MQMKYIFQLKKTKIVRPEFFKALVIETLYTQDVEIVKFEWKLTQKEKNSFYYFYIIH